MTITVINAGRKVGRGQLSNDREILAALERGETVYVKRNGCWILATQENGLLKYEALERKPEDVEG